MSGNSHTRRKARRAWKRQMLAKVAHVSRVFGEVPTYKACDFGHAPGCSCELVYERLPDGSIRVLSERFL